MIHLLSVGQQNTIVSRNTKVNSLITKMLTLIEKRILIWFYCAFCRFYPLPVMWKNGKMLLKPSSTGRRLWNCLTWTILLVTLTFQLVQIPIMIQEKKVNQLVVHGTLLLTHFEFVIFKLNIGLYKFEMVRLINQVFHLSSSWGINTLIILFIFDVACSTYYCSDVLKP